jgi:hypothetical protein
MAARAALAVRLSRFRDSRGPSGRMGIWPFLPGASACGLSPGLRSPGPLGRWPEIRRPRPDLPGRSSNSTWCTILPALRSLKTGSSWQHKSCLTRSMPRPKRQFGREVAEKAVTSAFAGRSGRVCPFQNDAASLEFRVPRGGCGKRPRKSHDSKGLQSLLLELT